jgi:hypothetical protein
MLKACYHCFDFGLPMNYAYYCFKWFFSILVDLNWHLVNCYAHLSCNSLLSYDIKTGIIEKQKSDIRSVSWRLQYTKFTM